MISRARADAACRHVFASRCRQMPRVDDFRLRAAFAALR